MFNDEKIALLEARITRLEERCPYATFYYSYDAKTDNYSHIPFNTVISAILKNFNLEFNEVPAIPRTVTLNKIVKKTEEIK